MARSMGLDVVAEGVETEVQFEFLKYHDYYIVQGNLISPPVQAAAFEQLLLTSKK